MEDEDSLLKIRLERDGLVGLPKEVKVKALLLLLNRMADEYERKHIPFIDRISETRKVYIREHYGKEDLGVISGKVELTPQQIRYFVKMDRKEDDDRRSTSKTNYKVL